MLDKYKKIRTEIYECLEAIRGPAKALLREKKYDGLLGLITKATMKYMMPPTAYDAYSITPYTPEVSKVLKIGYVNASFVTVLDLPVIACQAPLPGFVDEFCKLVTENHTELIVCLSPNPTYLSAFECLETKDIEATGETGKGHLLLRDRLLRKGEMTVRMIHCECWPDHGILAHSDMQRLYEYIEQTDETLRKAPQLIHCRAGVGRTGTYIMYKALRQMKEVAVDGFLDVLFQMRACRCYLVENIPQLQFLAESFLN